MTTKFTLIFVVQIYDKIWCRMLIFYNLLHHLTLYLFYIQLYLENCPYKTVNSNWFEISLRGKISLRCDVTSFSAFT